MGYSPIEFVVLTCLGLRHWVLATNGHAWGQQIWSTPFFWGGDIQFIYIYTYYLFNYLIFKFGNSLTWMLVHFPVLTCNRTKESWNECWPSTILQNQITLTDSVIREICHCSQHATSIHDMPWFIGAEASSKSPCWQGPHSRWWGLSSAGLPELPCLSPKSG